MSLNTKIIFLSIIFLGLFGLAGNSLAASPVLNFSDIDSGPKTGNSDGVGSGAIVTIWGNNLGSSQGSSKIYVGNVEATAIYYWKDADGNLPGGPSDLKTFHKMQEIAFAIPAGAADGANTIKVNVNGVDTNTLPFTVRAGNIKFIKNGGSDNSGCGNWTTPCATINYPFEGNGATAGNLYYSVGVGSSSGLRMGGTSALAGTSNSPIFFSAYPGYHVSISGNGGSNTVIPNWNNASTYVHMSKMTVTASNPTCDTNNDPVDGLHGSRGNRIVGMEFTGPTVYGGYGGAITCSSGGNTGLASYCGDHHYLGIYLHDFGQDNGWAYNWDSDYWTSPPYTLSGGKCYGADQKGHSSVNTVDRFQHLYYLSIRNNVGDIPAGEIGWNYIKDNPILHGIHIYDMGSPLSKWSGTWLIHDNAIVNQRGASLELAYPQSTPAKVWNNIIEASDNANGGIGIRVVTGGTAQIENNIVYGAKYSLLAMGNAGYDFRNNILWDTTGATYGFYWTSENQAPSTKSNNLFYGTASLPSWYSTGNGDKHIDPLFANAAGFDFSPSSASAPTVGTGYNLTSGYPTDMHGQRWTVPMGMGPIQYDTGVAQDTTSPTAPSGLSVQ